MSQNLEGEENGGSIFIERRGHLVELETLALGAETGRAAGPEAVGRDGRRCNEADKFLGVCKEGLALVGKKEHQVGCAERFHEHGPHH